MASTNPVVVITPPPIVGQPQPAQGTGKEIDPLFRPAPGSNAATGRESEQFLKDKATSLATDLFKDYLTRELRKANEQAGELLNSSSAPSSPGSYAPMNPAPAQAPTSPEANALTNAFWMDP